MIDNKGKRMCPNRPKINALKIFKTAILTKFGHLDTYFMGLPLIRTFLSILVLTKALLCANLYKGDPSFKRVFG